jgi:hypothetical protein
MSLLKRANWTQDRNGECILVLADWFDGKWVFSERSAWDACWYQVPPTSELAAKAEALAQRPSPDETAMFPDAPDSL